MSKLGVQTRLRAVIEQVRARPGCAATLGVTAREHSRPIGQIRTAPQRPPREQPVANPPYA
eukprot:4631848-Alexandrium_andersonii.AAC.1